MALSKDGINLLSLGNGGGRVVKDKDGLERFIHPLGACNYLKIESDNHLKFACQFYDDRQIRVQEQYEDMSGQTQFTDIFRIKVNEITLRELMLVQSIYACGTASEISNLVRLQPDPKIFFKVFLELGLKSLVSYLAFDNRSMRSLLDEDNEKYFSADFPVFFKQPDGKSAIDVCLNNNQIRSVNMITRYIINY